MKSVSALAFVLPVVWCLLSIRSDAGQADPPQKHLSAADLQTDFTIFQHAYETLHPGLYRYNTQAEMAAAFATLRAQLDHEQSLSQAYLAFSVFLAKVKCGHTYANFFNQSAVVAEPLFQQPGRVPFCFRWLDRRMIVTRGLSGKETLKPGTEILTLNGVPAARVLERLLTVARADGANDAKRIAYLEVRGDSRYEAFDVYYPLFFPAEADALEVRVRPPGGDAVEMTLRLPWQTYAQRLAAITPATGRPGDDQPLWTLSYPSPSTACLRMPTWATFNTKWNWQQFLDAAFEQFAARKTTNLILDLRGNEGGESEGEYILAKIVSQDLRLDEFKRLVRYRKVPDDLAPYLDTWDPSFKDWGESATPLPDGFFTLHRFDDAPGSSVVRASDHPFTGRVLVLIDANNSSATFQFAQTIQRTKRGTLIGQPTGGNQRGINGGAFFFLRLPKSQIETDLPLIGLYPTGELPPDAGLAPDVLVQPSVEDIASGADAEMATAMRFIVEHHQ